MTIVETGEEIDAMLRDAGSVWTFPHASLADKSFGVIFRGLGVLPRNIRDRAAEISVASERIEALTLEIGDQVEGFHPRTGQDEIWTVRDIQPSEDTAISVCTVQLDT